MTTDKQKLAGINILFGYFFAICMVVFLVAGGWRSYQSWRVRANWAKAEATVHQCQVRDYKAFARAGAMVYYVDCEFGFKQGDRSQTAHYRTQSVPANANLAIMQDWVVRHQTGSTQAIYVNPARPSEVRLAGDDAIELRTPSAMFVNALMFGMVSAGCFVLGFRMRRSASSTCASAG